METHREKILQSDKDKESDRPREILTKRRTDKERVGPERCGPEIYG